MRHTPSCCVTSCERRDLIFKKYDQLWEDKGDDRGVYLRSGRHRRWQNGASAMDPRQEQHPEQKVTHREQGRQIHRQVQAQLHPSDQQHESNQTGPQLAFRLSWWGWDRCGSLWHGELLRRQARTDTRCDRGQTLDRWLYYCADARIWITPKPSSSVLLIPLEVF